MVIEYLYLHLALFMILDNVVQRFCSLKKIEQVSKIKETESVVKKFFRYVPVRP